MVGKGCACGYLFLRMSVSEQVIKKVRAMSPAQAKKLLAYIKQREREEQQDRQDIEVARRALAEPGEHIPWEKVKADLGLK